jgi:hypothetical protein
MTAPSQNSTSWKRSLPPGRAYREALTFRCLWLKVSSNDLAAGLAPWRGGGHGPSHAAAAAMALPALGCVVPLSSKRGGSGAAGFTETAA